jgi:hypothetical protein
MPLDVTNGGMARAHPPASSVRTGSSFRKASGEAAEALGACPLIVGRAVSVATAMASPSLGAPGDDELTFDAHASGAHVVPFQREVGSGSGGELAAAHAATG